MYRLSQTPSSGAFYQPEIKNLTRSPPAPPTVRSVRPLLIVEIEAGKDPLRPFLRPPSRRGCEVLSKKEYALSLSQPKYFYIYIYLSVHHVHLVHSCQCSALGAELCTLNIGNDLLHVCLSGARDQRMA